MKNGSTPRAGASAETPARASREPRAKARRATRSAAQTRDLILQAALREFSKHGFAGARVERITQAAKTNDRMLYYYFQSKENLFRAALEQVYRDLRVFEEGLGLEQLSPVEAIRKLLRSIWVYYQEHPEFIALVGNENMYRAAHLRRSPEAQHLALPIVSILKSVFVRGATEGAFRSGLDPIQFYIAVAGFNYFYLSNQHTLGAVLQIDLTTQSSKSRWLAYVEDFVFKFLLRNP